MSRGRTVADIGDGCPCETMLRSRSTDIETEANVAATFEQVANTGPMALNIHSTADQAGSREASSIQQAATNHTRLPQRSMALDAWELPHDVRDDLWTP